MKKFQSKYVLVIKDSMGRTHYVSSRSQLATRFKNNNSNGPYNNGYGHSYNGPVNCNDILMSLCIEDAMAWDEVTDPTIWDFYYKIKYDTTVCFNEDAVRDTLRFSRITQEEFEMNDLIESEETAKEVMMRNLVAKLSPDEIKYLGLEKDTFYYRLEEANKRGYDHYIDYFHLNFPANTPWKLRPDDE